MILTVEMLQTWHGDSLYHLAGGADIKGNVCATRGMGAIREQEDTKNPSVNGGTLLRPSGCVTVYGVPVYPKQDLGNWKLCA
jgi:hypothetical protein